MSYTRPYGDAADFLTLGYTPPVGDSVVAVLDVQVDFRFNGDVYTRPSGDASDFDLPPSTIVAQFGPIYTRPAGSAVDFTWATAAVPEAVVAFSIDIAVEADAEHDAEIPEAVGAFSIEIAVEADAAHGISGSAAFSIEISAEADAAHGISGSAAFSIDVSADGEGAHGVSGTAAFSIEITAAVVSEHPRYVLKGEVRDAGVLVNRTVRAYRRSDGALIGEQLTDMGRFDIHAGFAVAEHYLLPIDLDSGATDFTPPAVNRVLSVLAED